MIRIVTMIADKAGSLGSAIAAMGCASCFPALGAFGASLGLGFLAPFEGLFINTLLPTFAIIAMVANLLSWWSHRVVWRALLALAGPAMVLATLYVFWTDSWSTYMFYVGIGLMLIVSIYDIVWPPKRSCRSAAQSITPLPRD